PSGRARRFAARRVDQVDHRFGLCEVELALEEGAPGELAGLGEARARGKACFEKRLQDDRPAMALELDYRFPRIGRRGRKIEKQALVDQLAFGIPETAVAGGARRRQLAGDLPRELGCRRPRNPDLVGPPLSARRWD